MIWQVIVMNGRQKPVATKVILVLVEVVVGTTKAVTCAVALATKQVADGLALRSAPFCMYKWDLDERSIKIIIRY